MGVPVDQIATLKATAEELVPVYPENWKTVLLFAQLGTQWRVSMSGPTGLDYSALPAVAQALRIKLTPKRFAGLREMEAEALICLRESADRGG